MLTILVHNLIVAVTEYANNIIIVFNTLVYVSSMNSTQLLSCNLVTSNNLQRLVHSCLFYPEHLIYLDLRCNKLQSINGIEQLQTLKILYLHGNDIQSITDLLPLKQMNLDALTVHGNPLVRQHNYKLFVINQLASLKRLDFGGITKRDRLEAAEAQKMNLISLVVNENVDIGRK
ncbi:U2_small nuclear ribonucleoprotein A' putative [Hexamita inflata]|uniref:Leucine-rich repeat-containing protein 51 n=1 Tax=Hexamita inflata TaxID=28002 RepID=A0AA86Q2C6_9EUKA|nr:U2 small nuclear ribonucleoprotein A' putative [Hexamita inflata]